MFPRVGGAILALAAAALLAVAIVAMPWWDGHPEITMAGEPPTTMRLKSVDVGPLGAHTCNTGGDGACSSTTRDPGPKIVGFATSGAGGIEAILLLVLSMTTLSRKDSRRSVGKVAMVVIALAGVLGLAVLALGPGIKAPNASISLPKGIGFLVYFAGIATAIAAILVTAREIPRALFIPRASNANAQLPNQGPFDVRALIGDDHQAQRPSQPHMAHDQVRSPGGALAGPSGPLAPPLFASAPQLRPLYEMEGHQLVPVQAPLPDRAPTPLPREAMEALNESEPSQAERFAPRSKPSSLPPPVRSKSSSLPPPIGTRPSAVPPPPRPGPASAAARPSPPASAATRPSPPASAATGSAPRKTGSPFDAQEPSGPFGFGAEQNASTGPLGAAAFRPFDPSSTPVPAPPAIPKTPPIPKPQYPAKPTPTPFDIASPGAIAPPAPSGAPFGVLPPVKAPAGSIKSFVLPMRGGTDGGSSDELAVTHERSSNEAAEVAKKAARESQVVIERPATSLDGEPGDHTSPNVDLRTSEEAALQQDDMLASPPSRSGDIEGDRLDDDAAIERRQLDEADAMRDYGVVDTSANPVAPPVTSDLSDATEDQPATAPQPITQEAPPKIPITTASEQLPPPTKKQAQTSGPSPACPQCEAPMAWVEEHLRFYCKSCRMYF